MIRKILALLFPPRAFPEPNGVLDDLLLERIEREHLADLARRAEFDLET